MAGLILATMLGGNLRAIGVDGCFVHHDCNPKMDAFVSGCKPIPGLIPVFYNGLICFMVIVSEDSLKLFPDYSLAEIAF